MIRSTKFFMKSSNVLTKKRINKLIHLHKVQNIQFNQKEKREIEKEKLLYTKGDIL